MSALTRKSLDTFMQSSQRFSRRSRFPCFVTMDPESPLRGVFYFPEKLAHEIQFVRIEVKQDNSIGATDQEKRAEFVGKEILIPLEYGGLIRQEIGTTLFGIDTILGIGERIVLEEDCSLLNSNETDAKFVPKGTVLGCFRVLEEDCSLLNSNETDAKFVPKDTVLGCFSALQGSATRKLYLLNRNCEKYIVKENTPLNYSAIVDLNPKAKMEDFLRVQKVFPKDVIFDNVSMSDVASSIPEEFEKLRIMFCGIIRIKSIETHEFYIGWLRTSSKHFTVSLIPRNVACNWNVRDYIRADERERSDYTYASYEEVYGAKLFTKSLGVTTIIVSIPGKKSHENIYVESLIASRPETYEGHVSDEEN